MSIRYDSLDPDVRRAMIQELDRDIAGGPLYVSKRLTEEGAKAWPQILREAFEHHDDDWIASTLRSRGLLRTHEERNKPKGGTTIAQVPVTAADTMAEGEFNRFYARGLCVNVIATGGTDVEVYRGKAAQNPRPQSEAMLGKHVPAQALLDDLRTSQGVEPALKLPPGPNSGLTIRRPTR